MQPDEAAAALSGLLIGTRDRVGAQPLRQAPERRSSWSPPGRSATSTPRRSSLAGYRVQPVDADEAVRAGLLEAARASRHRRPARSDGMSDRPCRSSRAASSPSCAACAPHEAVDVGRGRVRGRHRGDRGAAQFARPVPLDRDASSPALPTAALVGAGTVLTADDVERLARRRRPAAGQPQRRRRRACGAPPHLRHGHHARRVHADRSLSRRSRARRIGAEILPGERARPEGHRGDRRRAADGRRGRRGRRRFGGAISPTTPRSACAPSAWAPASTSPA